MEVGRKIDVLLGAVGMAQHQPEGGQGNMFPIVRLSRWI